MSIEEFNALKDEDIQAIHARQHILVTGLPKATYGFDEKGLSTLAPPSRIITVQGLSKYINYISSHTGSLLDWSIYSSHNENARLTNRTTRDLLQSANSPNGRIFNALDFPLPLSGHPPMSISSDLAAWKGTAALEGCEGEFPLSGIRWGLAACEGAFSGYHVDTGGLATYIDCKNIGGSKFWIVSGASQPSSSTFLSDIEKVFSFHSRSNDKYEVTREMETEGVLLTPGTRLCVE
jgi:hypothetical protein